MKPRLLMLGALACLAIAWRPGPRLMWNATASVPIGLYRLASPDAPLIGDLVVLQPTPNQAAFLEALGWLPRGVPLLKPVAAVAGQEVCRLGERVTIDGVAVARALKADATGRPLPVWAGCRRLADDELFVVATAPGSFDSRYFGPIPLDAVSAIAHPLWRPDPAGQLGEGRRP